MKKFLFLAIAAAAMTSCSQDEVLEVAQKQAISFGNAFVGNSTRATDPSYSTIGKGTALTQFNVYGTVASDNGTENIFNNVLIEKGDAAYGAEWTQAAGTTTQYWIPGADYKFVGIVDGNKTGVTATTLGANNMPTSISYTADGSTDLLCATVVRNDNTDYSVVPFEFTHLLSKVNFTVTNKSTAASGYSFVVKNINFAGNLSGSYDVENAEWTDDDFATGNTSVGNDNNNVKSIVIPTGTASVELNNEVLFLPGTYTISFTVDVLYNGTVMTTTNYPASGSTYSQTLVANSAYNFNVEVSIGQEIKFTATEMDDWNNGNTAKSEETLEENDIVPVA